MPSEEKNRLRITEYLDLDLDREQWLCNRCGHAIGPARENYKRGCLLYDRDPREIHPALVSGEFHFSPDPLWVRIVEFYCPAAARKSRPNICRPAIPITHDIEIDLDRLKERLTQRRIQHSRAAARGRRMNSIDIDVGGTFTDLVLNLRGKALIKKVPTTPYDLSVCFSRVIEEGAGSLGLKMDELLPAIDMIRYSTTIAMNRLIEKKGPRLGLITTEGHEDVVLIGRGAQWIDGTRVAERRNLAIQKKPDPLIPRDLIVGVKERIDSRGQIVRPLDEEDVRAKVRNLVNRGVRGFVVSLLWGFLNPAHERRMKEIIRDEYKEFHIGFLPVVLAGKWSASSANTSEPWPPSSTLICSGPCRSSFPPCGTSCATAAIRNRCS